MKTIYAIVMIDDDLDDIDIFKEALDEVSPATQFFSFTNFETCYQFLSDENRPLPELIFLDLNLPKVSGLGYLKPIKDIPRVANSKIIIYTTTLHPKQEEEARALNAYRCVQKPVGYMALCDLIKGIIEEASQLTELPPPNTLLE